MVGRHPNFSFHRQVTHPLVSKHGAEMTPGWNCTNHEIKASKRFACYVFIDKSGQIVFQGRLTFEEVEAKVKELLRR